ncbi:hypothetical protein Hdeb2414_s0001g00019461 [Helianthus debilis subsp. tardiflorus]
MGCSGSTQFMLRFFGFSSESITSSFFVSSSHEKHTGSSVQSSSDSRQISAQNWGFGSNPVDSVNTRVNSGQHWSNRSTTVNSKDPEYHRCTLANTRSWNDTTESR